MQDTNVDVKIPSLGQTTMAFSTPVMIASDQPPIPVEATIDTTGLATDIGQAAGNSSLSSIDGKLPSLVSGRVPVDGSAVIQPVSGTFWQTTQPTSLAALPALAAGSAIIGKVGIDQTTPGTTNGVQINAALPAGTNAIGKLASNSGVTIGAVELAAAQTVGLAAGSAKVGQIAIDQTTPGTTNLVQVGGSLPAGTNRIGSVRLVDSSDADLTTTKGTQSSRFQGVQDAKDSGRVHIQLFATAAAAGATTVETLITLTKSSGFGATSSGTDYTITNGKRFRITSITVATRGHSTATIQTTTFTFRINAGAVATNSTAWLSARSATPATASAWDRLQLPIPDGLELLGDGTNRIGVSANATYATNAPTWDVYIIGYEY